MEKLLTFFFIVGFSLSSNAQLGQIKPMGDSSALPAVSATGYYYFFPGTQNNTLTLIGYLDYKSIHLEPRYNYEGQNTGSIFAGWTFETNGKLDFSVTPMVGFVFGSLQGFAPGLEMELSYRKFDFYTENEWVIDYSGKENNFFYGWTELGYSPVEKFRTGLSAQRTRLYQNNLDFQRGIFVEYSLWKLTAGFHYFNPFSSEYFFIASLNFEL